MKTFARIAYCIALILALAILTSSCSSILDRIRGQSQPTTQTKTPTKTSTPKPAEPKTKEPEVSELIKKGKVQRVGGDYPGAIASFKQVLKIDPNNEEAAKELEATEAERDKLVNEHMKQGVEYSTQENLQAAMQEWDKVLELDPSNEKALEYKELTQKKLDALK